MNEKYKIILVDDEDDVRGRILSKINEDNGFVVVGKAGNGYDALELIEEHLPNLVLTDIKMPFVDGIELAKIIKRDYPTVKVAFISGYDEFNYAREAINLNVLSYLTKPVTSNDIDNFLKKVKSQLDEEREYLKDITAIKEKYNEMLPIIGDSYLSNLLVSPIITSSGIEKLKIYGIDVGVGNFISCLLEIDQNDSFSIEEIEKYKVRINEILKARFKHYIFTHSLIIPNGLVFIIKTDNGSITEIDNILFEVIKTVEKYLQVDIKIGVSTEYNNFCNFPESFKEAKRALGYSQFMNLSRIVYADELDNFEVSKSFSIDKILFDIEHIVRYGSDKSVEQMVEKIRINLLNHKDIFAHNHSMMVISFANIVIKLSKNIDSNILETLSSYKTIESFLEYLTTKIEKIRKDDIDNHESRTERMLKGTLDYITKNYSNPSLSLETVCDEMKISISHLSMLLKKRKGITFNKFLIKTRLDKAIELLKTTDMKIVDISQICGYNEVYYFSHSFKKYTGLPPGEYRKNARL